MIPTAKHTANPESNIISPGKFVLIYQILKKKHEDEWK